MVLSGKESDDLSASAVGQVAACGEPFQQVGEAEFTVCAGSASAQDLDGVVAFLRCGASKGVQQHQGSLALPQVAADLFAVVLRIGPQIQQVIGDLEGRPDVSTEGLQRGGVG